MTKVNQDKANAPGKTHRPMCVAAPYYFKQGITDCTNQEKPEDPLEF